LRRRHPRNMLQARVEHRLAERAVLPAGGQVGITWRRRPARRRTSWRTVAHRQRLLLPAVTLAAVILVGKVHANTKVLAGCSGRLHRLRIARWRLPARWAGQLGAIDICRSRNRDSSTVSSVQAVQATDRRSGVASNRADDGEFRGSATACTPRPRAARSPQDVVALLDRIGAGERPYFDARASCDPGRSSPGHRLGPASREASRTSARLGTVTRRWQVAEGMSSTRTWPQPPDSASTLRCGPPGRRGPHSHSTRQAARCSRRLAPHHLAVDDQVPAHCRDCRRDEKRDVSLEIRTPARRAGPAASCLDWC